MSRKALTQKNTLLKAAEANAATKAFKRVFFSPPQENFLPPLFFLIKLFSPTHGLSANTNSCASNVNRFVETVCGLQTTPLRTNSTAAANIRLKEILKKGALTVIRTVVHLTNSCGYTNSRASNPPFLKLL